MAAPTGSDQEPKEHPEATTSADLVLTGGLTLDFLTSVRSPISVRVCDGRIATVSADPVQADGARLVDCSGLLVVPALVDLHSHVHDGVFDVAVPAEDAHLRRGVAVVNDAGSVGLSGFRGFRSYTAEPSSARITSFLNVSSVGLVNIHISEFADPHAVLIDEAAELISANPDLIRGVKVRLSRSEAGDQPLQRLAQALDLAERACVPLMAHVGATDCTLGEILDELRPGDIVTHCFHGKSQGLIRDGRVISQAWKARSRGVLFDIGHGTTQMSYAVARAALAEGFQPDTISSDLSRRNWMAPAYDLATVVSKMVALGLQLGPALSAATTVPAAVLGVDGEGYGSIRPGGVAAITVFREASEPDILPDAQHNQLEVYRLEPVHVLHRDAVYQPVGWRGSAAA